MDGLDSSSSEPGTLQKVGGRRSVGILYRVYTVALLQPSYPGLSSLEVATH